MVATGLGAALPTQAQSSDPSARFGDVFAMIRANYVEPLDMAPLIGVAVEAIRTRATLDEDAWARCIGAKPSGPGDVAKALRCAGLAQRGPEAEAAVDAAIGAMVAKLDAHSAWAPFAPAEPSDHPGAPAASVGLKLKEDNRRYTVISAGTASAAGRAGIRQGDELIAIDGTRTADLSFDELIAKLRGPVDSAVTLTIRHQDGALAEFPLRRTIVRQLDMELQTERRGAVLILRLSGLSYGVTRAVRETLLSEEGATSALILDLQGNQGGLLSETVALADLFLDKGVIVTSRGREPRDVENYRASRGQTAQGIPILVLVNEDSAAGAEILAAALQDNKRATVFGHTTQGAGSVQTILPLGSRSALRLTTSHEYRADGRKLADAPVVPDCPSTLDASALLDQVAALAATPPIRCPASAREP